MVMTGRRIGGDEALCWGLAHRSVDPDTLDAETTLLVDELLSMPPGPLAMTKAAFAAIGRAEPGMAIAWSDPDVSAWAASDAESAAAAAAYRQRHLGGSAPGDRPVS